MSRPVSRKTRVLAVAVVLLSAGFAGCAKEEAVVNQVVQKPVPKKVAPPPADAKPADNVTTVAARADGYDPTGKRDPFLPFLRPRPKAPPRPEQGEALSPLMQGDVREYRFVGVIWNPRGYRALVEDIEGKGYTVTVGSRLGRGGAVVTRITDKELALKEEFQDYSGATVVRESSLKLNSAGGK